MARKPITAYAGGKGPRQHIWEALRRLAAADAPFTDEDVLRACPRSEKIIQSAVADYRRCLLNAGILATVSECVPRRFPATYRLAKDEGLDAPRVRADGSRVTQGLAQEQMWRTLRMMPGDTNGRELAAHAGTESVPVAEASARAYLQMLHQAGYLTETVPGKGKGQGGVQARYRLKALRNTGPRPPMICRQKVVYDPNEDRVVWSSRVSPEDAE